MHQGPHASWKVLDFSWPGKFWKNIVESMFFSLVVQMENI